MDELNCSKRSYFSKLEKLLPEKLRDLEKNSLGAEND
jgi:hypothetical protein